MYESLKKAGWEIKCGERVDRKGGLGMANLVPLRRED
jgi:hypothetical protein